MAKRTPLPCTPENCGETFPKCGSRNTYASRKYKCRCDSCHAANVDYMRQYKAGNRETLAEKKKQHYNKKRKSILAGQKQYRKANRIPEIHNERNRQWRLDNPERAREYYRRAMQNWRLDNPERAQASGRLAAHVRKARIKAATVVVFTVDQLDQRMAYYGYSCYLKLPGLCTGAFDEIEHVKPLSKGGAHMLANVRPACTPCNAHKHDKWPFKFAA